MPILRPSHARWHLLTTDCPIPPATLIAHYKSIQNSAFKRKDICSLSQRAFSIHKEIIEDTQTVTTPKNVSYLNGNYKKYDELEKWSIENTPPQNKNSSIDKFPKVRRMLSTLSKESLKYFRVGTLAPRHPKKNIKGSGDLSKKLKPEEEESAIEICGVVDSLKQKIERYLKKYDNKKEKLRKLRAMNAELSNEQMHYIGILNALRLEKLSKSAKKCPKSKGKLKSPSNDSLSSGEYSNIKPQQLDAKKAECEDQLNTKLSLLNENKFKEQTLIEKCANFKAEISRATLELYETLVNMLSGSDCTLQNGLSWVIKEIWRIGYKVDSTKIPKMLDSEAVGYLFSIAQKEVELDSLLKEKHKMSLRISSMYFGNEQKQACSPIKSQLINDLHHYCQTTSAYQDTVNKRPLNVRVATDKGLICSVIVLLEYIYVGQQEDTENRKGYY